MLQNSGETVSVENAMFPVLFINCANTLSAVYLRGVTNTDVRSCGKLNTGATRVGHVVHGCCDVTV